MTIAYWSLLVAIIFPYVFTVLAKSTPEFNNNDPRAYLHNLSGWRKRADYVQKNSFEITPIFGIAIIVATILHASQTRIDLFALIFLASRVVYALCYLADKAALRSLFWGISMASVIAIYLLPV